MARVWRLTAHPGPFHEPSVFTSFQTAKPVESVLREEDE